MPVRLVKNCADSLLATHLEDLSEINLQRVAMLLGKFKPGLEQLVRPGLPHGCKVQLLKQASVLEAACQQIIGNLSKKAPGLSNGGPSVLHRTGSFRIVRVSGFRGASIRQRNPSRDVRDVDRGNQDDIRVLTGIIAIVPVFDG